ncbi:MAG: 2OG-Fe(II) oxygenase, partial [Myxococcales bacterium]|nr:2OG-Fe(II) oxygenase [Myxococcales bacterium]
VAAAYPSFEEAEKIGHQFVKVNELRKIQITESEKFPDPIRRLHEALATREVREALAALSGIDDLLYDDTLAGGGMHMTAAHGRLDVHVDFNYLEPQRIYRRLNLLVYLNPTWRPSWGGAVELWDRDVQHRYAVFTPKHNRAVLFETSEISFHGVTACACPEDITRNSFAVYYYTKEPPPGYDGVAHSTIFKA